MNRIYCVSCSCFMKKERTGFQVTIAQNPRIDVRGDEYRCSECDRLVYGDFGEPFEVGKK